MTSATTDRRRGLTADKGYKAPVTVATTANITLSGEQTIDGVAVLESNAAGFPDRVLVKNQTDTTQNGIYDVSTGTWTRSLDCNKVGDMVTGTQVLIARGTQAFQIWGISTTTNPITPGTTALAFTQSLSAGFLATLAASGGSALVGTIGTATGEVATTVSAALNLKVKGLKKSFGAAGGGVANDYTAINNAFQASGKIIEIEDDTFLCNTAPAAPICAGIVGFGSEVSKLKAGAGVLKMLSLVGATAPTHLRDFAILGNSTNNARGIIYGDGALTANIHAQRVAVRNYTGTGAIGEYIRDMVSLTLDMCQVSGNTVNRQIEAQTLQPTTIAIRGGVNELAVKQGMKVISASGVTLSDEHIIQTNGEEGLLIAPNSSNVLSFKILGGWVEGNWYSLLADAVTRLTKFQVDATQVAASTIQLIVEHTKFDAVAKSIRLGAGNAGFSLFKPQVANLAGAITVVAGYGTFELPDNLDPTTLVSVTNPGIALNVGRIGTQQPAYAATYQPDFGLGSYTVELGTLTGNMTVSNPVSASFPAKGQRVVLIATQDGTGGRTLTFGTDYIFPTAYTNTGNTAGKKTTIEFISGGTKLVASGANSWY